MGTEDLANVLQDTLDALAELAIVNNASPQQHTLRINAGRIIATLREQLDDLDYAYTLFTCEIEPVTAEHYKRIYLASVREQMEVQS